MEETDGTYEDIDGDLIEVPASPLVRVEKHSGWGRVAELDDDELLDECELERWVEWQEWGPILELPLPRRRSHIRPNMDESGRVDWGAFGTVDFERLYGSFDKARYKADILREKLNDVLITIDIVQRRLPPQAALVLKYVQMGMIQREHIISDDILAMLRLQNQVEQLRAEIEALRTASRRRRPAAVPHVLATRAGT
jgi:hypothetical protein